MTDALKITRSGITINVTTSSLTPVNLPTNEAGENPRMCRLLADTGIVYVKVAAGSLTAGGAQCTPTLNDIMVNANEPLLLNTRGQGVIAAITRALTANLNVIPIEC